MDTKEYSLGKLDSLLGVEPQMSDDNYLNGYMAGMVE